VIDTLVRPAPPASKAGPIAAPARHRPDIQGLRAVAVVLVVLAHAGVPGLSGGYVGVDVFFVISGFLITGLLLRERLSTGRLSLAGFYARRAVRLLPASTAVAVITLAASWQWLPPARITALADDALSAAGYAINVRLAAVATDYFANPAPSPFQHFWSLAVEEQFYLGWPLLVVVVLFFGRLRALAVVLSVVVAGSLAYSAFELTWNAPAAYFGLPSRAWELGVGALIAVFQAGRRPLWITSAAARVVVVGSGAAPPRPGWGRSVARPDGQMINGSLIRTALGWAGLAAILVSAVALTDDSPFPGFAALPPVIGAALVIAAGGPGKLLGRRPLTKIGDYSYSLYLWHWPLLIIGPAAIGHALGIGARLGLCALALMLAALTYHFVENPVRHRRPLTARPIRGLTLGLGLSGVTATLAGLALAFPPAVPTGGIAPDTRAALRTAGDPAAELGHLIDTAEGVREVPDNLVPTLTAAPREESAPQTDGCHQTLQSAAQQPACTYGPAAATRTVVVVGDSHALQWFPAFQQLAERDNWRLVSLTRSSCLPADLIIRNARMKRRYTECEQWRTWALGRIDRLRPDMVVVTSDTNYPGMLAGHPADPDRLWSAAWTRLFTRLKAASRHVVLLADTPTLSADPLDCLGSHGRDIRACTEPAATVLRDPAWRAEVQDAARKDAVPIVDPTPWLCGRDCPLVVGNVLVYRDTNHLTGAYAGMLGPLLGASLPHLP
jgi:peptidoglycan/LPS O-acetylase OafA/YrhL